MCGRTCCTLSPSVLPLACTLVTKGHRPPEWVQAGKAEYTPSTNLMPSAHSPVMCIGEQLGHKEDPVVLKTMLWGFVPSWHKGDDPTKVNFSNINARVEGLSESKVYSPSLKNDRRCVVVCDGFYEWHKEGRSGKQPYLVYVDQHDEGNAKKVLEMAKCTRADFKDGQWKGPKPVFMAGRFQRGEGGGGGGGVVSISLFANAHFSFLCRPLFCLAAEGEEGGRLHLHHHHKVGCKVGGGATQEGKKRQSPVSHFFPSF